MGTVTPEPQATVLIFFAEHPFVSKQVIVCFEFTQADLLLQFQLGVHFTTTLGGVVVLGGVFGVGGGVGGGVVVLGMVHD